MYGFTVNCDGNSIAQLKKIEMALAEAGVTAKVEVGKIEGSFTQMGTRVKEVFGELKGIIAGGLIAAGIFGGFEFIKNSKEEFEQLEQAITRVNTALTSTKFAAGLSSLNIQDQAKSLSKDILASRSEIMDAQGMLLSFTGIKGPVFGETTKAVADFATFYKTDMTSSALAIGKALNNPAQGMNRLQRMGVAFTDEQKKQIKNYQEQGKLAMAQGVILKELNTEFGGQAKSFALTDKGKEIMADKEWEDLKVKIGEVVSKIEISLIPTFRTIRDYVSAAFDSAPMQFFIAHIKDLITIGMKLIPIWLTYKGVMLANSLVTGIFAVENGILTASFGSLTLMTDGATVATEGFGAALAATGVGAFAVALGLIVEKFMSINKQIDDTVDKIGDLKKNTEGMDQSNDRFHEIANKFGIINQLGVKAKESLYQDLVDQRDDLQKRKDDIAASQQAYQEAYKKANVKVGEHYENQGQGQHVRITDYAQPSAIREGIRDALQSTNGQLKDINRQLGAIDGGFKVLKKQGITHGLTPDNANTVIKQNADNISALSGAKGGLSDAKVININFHKALQEVNVADGKGVVTAGRDAVEYIIKALNNMAFSQGSTM